MGLNGYSPFGEEKKNSDGGMTGTDDVSKLLLISIDHIEEVYLYYTGMDGGKYV